MSQVVVKFDSTIKHSDIYIPLTNSSKEEAGIYYRDNQPEIQQTKVHGIISPIVAINGIVVDFDAIKEFSLKSSGSMPVLTMVLIDKFNITRTLDSPGQDNEIRVEILPRFENVYKKINMTFYISNIRISGNIMNITGLYKLPQFNSSLLRSFGEIGTYDFAETVAKETGLGFASNIANSTDKRYIYSDNKSYMELLSREIVHSGSDYEVLDWWIDYWNNLNLVDIYERYNATDSDDKLTTWICTQLYEVQEGADIQPSQVISTLTNHPQAKASELYAYKYDIRNKTGANVSQGTDKMYASYSLNQGEYTDKLVQDGDVQKDIFSRFEYLGEVYGDYNYLIADKLRTSFLQKMNNESIEVSLPSPVLGLMRGHRVNFAWYVNDSLLKNKEDIIIDEGVANEINTSEPMNEEPYGDDGEGGFRLDKMISGQYLITSTHIKYSNNKWEYVLTLNRPSKNKPKLLNNE